jgi:MinD superfamily P-loop ATPase
MKITIASGKGGTGKTTIATNLAWLASKRGVSTAYLDCDVEEPNGAIFLQPTIEHEDAVSMPVPAVNESRCTKCSRCARVCRYSAIVVIKETILVNPSMCHGCGACTFICPEQAITETPWPIGIIRKGRSDTLHVTTGLMNIGVAMSPPLIRAVKRGCPDVQLAIFDAPPGTSCPVVETVRESDHVILVTEPTPFGLNDLTLAVEMVRALHVPMSIVINRALPDNTLIDDYCSREGLHIGARIADDRRIAEAYSRGQRISDAMPDVAGIFESTLSQLLQGGAR